MIRLEREDGLWTVVIDRPDRANALTAAMLEELVAIFESAGEARALIVTGRGRVFSAGADLAEARAGLATSPLWERLSGALAALPGLTVAALNGTAAGGALGMVLACDLRLAVPAAEIFYPVMKLGFLPQPSDPARMAALIGPARTRLILMGGQRIPAREACDFGLVDRIVEPETLLEAARGIVADALAARPEVAAGIAALCPRPAAGAERQGGADRGGAERAGASVTG